MENKLTVAIDQTMFVKWYIRLLNLVIDILVVIMLFFLLVLVAALLTHVGYYGLSDWITNMSGLTDRFVTTFIMVAYLFLMENFTQRSVGKFITGTMVVSERGGRPSVKSFLTRALCRIIWLQIFSFMAKFPRGWHDTASDTYVVDRKKYMEALQLKNSFEEIGNEATL